MTEQEIEMAMESLFVGAEKVRAKKHVNTLSRNVHREFTSRIASQLWDLEKRTFKAA